MRNVFFLLLFLCSNLQAMYPLLFSFRNIRTCFNTHDSFNRTHFIRGYSQPQPVNAPRLPRSAQIPKHNQKYPIVESFFSPHIFAALSQSLEQAQEKIDVAVFCFTDERIAQHLIKAHKRGVKVRVIMDTGNVDMKYSQVPMLINNGISVLRFEPSKEDGYKKSIYDRHMHLKVVIADDELWTGSANLTNAALKGYNKENFLRIKCPAQLSQYQALFDDLEKRCTPCEKKSVAKSAKISEKKQKKTIKE